MELERVLHSEHYLKMDSQTAVRWASRTQKGAQMAVNLASRKLKDLRTAAYLAARMALM